MIRTGLAAAEALKQRLSSQASRFLLNDRREFIGPTPLVTFTLDDAPDTAATIGAQLLESYGARGVYYLATNLIGQTTEHFSMLSHDDVLRLHRAGHEIGLHSHTHQSAHEHSPASFAADLCANRDQLAMIDPDIRPSHFAYPYGAISLPVKARLKGLVESSRGITHGVNHGVFDAQDILAVQLGDARLTRAELQQYLKEAQQRRGWLVFLTHDISENPSPYGCTPELFTEALAGAVAHNLQFATMSDAFRQTRAVTSAKGLHKGVKRALRRGHEQFAE